MKLDPSDLPALRPLIAEVVRATLAEVQAEQAKVAGRIGFTEAEAAALLGVERHALRDARLRGELAARRVGRRVVYSRLSLEKYLAEGDQ